MAQTPETIYIEKEHYTPKNETESYDGAKEKEYFFSQLDINTSLIVNQRQDDPETSIREDRPLFLPNSLGIKFGRGVHKDRWFGISAHSGFDWKFNERLFLVPVYGNFTLSPDLGGDSRLVFQAGYGKGFAIGRGQSQGKYQKYSLGLESDENNFGIFIEIAWYDFNVYRGSTTDFFNIGIYKKFY